MTKLLPVLAFAAAAPFLISAQEHPADPERVENSAEHLEDDIFVEVEMPGSCTDTIQRVRQESGLPPLDRRNASPDEPIMFKAVDYDVSGCDVLLTSDGEIRDLPETSDGGPLMHRAQ